MLESVAYIEVYNLGEQRNDDKHQQNVEKPLLELASVFARCLSHNSCTETLCRNDTQSSNQTANRDVHHHRLLAVLGAKIERNEHAGNDHNARVAEKARRNDPLLHVLYPCDRGLLGSIDGNNDRSDDAVETADFSNKTEALLEEDGG